MFDDCFATGKENDDNDEDDEDDEGADEVGSALASSTGFVSLVNNFLFF